MRENEVIKTLISANLDEFRIGVCSDDTMITNIAIKSNAQLYLV